MLPRIWSRLGIPCLCAVNCALWRLRVCSGSRVLQTPCRLRDLAAGRQSVFGCPTAYLPRPTGTGIATIDVRCQRYNACTTFCRSISCASTTLEMAPRQRLPSRRCARFKLDRPSTSAAAGGNKRNSLGASRWQASHKHLSQFRSRAHRCSSLGSRPSDSGRSPLKQIAVDAARGWRPHIKSLPGATLVRAWLLSMPRAASPCPCISPPLRHWPPRRQQHPMPAHKLTEEVTVATL